jgi:hypothetical protein
MIQLIEIQGLRGWGLDARRMLAALQDDVSAWPQQVTDVGVTKSDGAAYIPLARTNAIVRTPDDPEATLRYMIDVWEAADRDHGSDGSAADPEVHRVSAGPRTGCCFASWRSASAVPPTRRASASSASG